jgi:glycosyltransferase involved in cell wall biosynthesis
MSATEKAMAVGSICVVSIELDFLYRNGGIGTSNWQLCHLLAKAGWRVHILHCGLIEAPEKMAAVHQILADAGIALTLLNEFSPPQPVHQGAHPSSDTIGRSDLVLVGLEALHREHRFDLVQFSEWGSLGIRPLQAKQAGVALRGANSIVKLHSPTKWLRKGNNTWRGTIDDLFMDFIERRSFELADCQIAASQCILGYARQIGWHIRGNARVVHNPFPAPSFPPAPLEDSPPREIVFFGRLEPIKGIDVFLAAVRGLDPRIPLTFLGKDVLHPSGLVASHWIRSRLPGRDLRFLTGCDRAQALAYLAEGGRLAVLPSLLDNYPNAVIECAVNGIPFLTSRVGGIPEIVSDAALQEQILFEPHARDLKRCLSDYLAAPAAQRSKSRDCALALLDVRGHNQEISDFYSACLTRVRKPAAMAPPSAA